MTQSVTLIARTLLCMPYEVDCASESVGATRYDLDDDQLHPPPRAHPHRDPPHTECHSVSLAIERHPITRVDSADDIAIRLVAS